MTDATQQDSPLSVTANIAGILTFVVAIVAAVYVRITYLRNSDREYFQVKTSLSWYKTESTWLAELVKATGDQPNAKYQTEYQMYNFVMDDLVRLEQRLLEIVEEIEIKAGSEDEQRGDTRWTIVPKSWGFTTAVAMAWLPARTKALELVRQRDALAARVSFTQMSMISSRIRDLEQRNKMREATVDNNLKRLEAIIGDQKAEIYRLEDLVCRIIHRNRVGLDGDGPPTSPRPRKGPDLRLQADDSYFKKRRRRREDSKWQVELNNGPDPDTAQRRRLLHNSKIPVPIRDVDQVAAGADACNEENGLAEGRLKSSR
ncbi:N-acetylglucosaminyl-phosphatidylinositol de-N-acetylase [Parahypoxylon ruwenzoriense]